METNPFTQEDMLRGRLDEGSAMIDSYKSSLEAAAGQDQSSIDSLRGIYNDPSKFRKSELGAFASALGKPGGSGRFSDSMNSALSAANDTREYNKVQNLDREEKLAKLASLQAALTRQQANDTMGVYDKQSGYLTQSQTDQGMLADIELGKAPKGPRMLNPGEEGPEAPGSSPFEQSMKIINDFYRNPGNYRGPEGQAMVARAFEMQKAERIAQSRENVAATKAAAKPTISGPEQRRVSGRIKALDETAEGARSLKTDVALLRAARDKVDYEGTPGAGLWASLSGWATDSGAYGQEVRSKAVSMKLTLSEKLKGAISNAEQVMLDSASPGLAMVDAAAGPVLDGYEAAADRAIERSKFLKAWTTKNGDDYGADDAWDAFVNDNPIVMKDEATGELKVNKNNVGSWQGYVTDVNAEDGGGAPAAVNPDLGFNPDNLPPNVKAWVEEQLDGGASEEQIIEYLRENFGEAGQ